jgi:hypothetical protein
VGGESKQTQTQSSTTNPWEPAQGALKGILGQLDPLIANSGLSPTASGAIDQLQQSANQGNPFAGQINDFTTNLLNGGGATAQSGAVQGGLDQYKQQMAKYADPNYSSLNDPKLQAALAQIQSDVGSSVNSQFAAAGRDMSGANQMAYGRGVSAAQAPLILDQFNQDRSLQQNAAGSLYGAQNTTSGLLSGMNQQGLTNQQQGVTNSADALAAKNYGAAQTLNLEQLRQSLPAQNLGLLAQIGVPIAGLGGQSTGTSNTTNQMSGADQFGKIAAGANNLINPLKFLGF